LIGSISGYADEVTLSLKGANNPTRGRKLRSTGTKARARIGQVRKPHADLERQLDGKSRRAATVTTGAFSDPLRRSGAGGGLLRGLLIYCESGWCCRLGAT
jgi:hypothetical protein